MSYTKQTWTDNDPTKPLSAARMNALEAGLEAAAAAADAANAAAASAAAAAATAAQAAAAAQSAATAATLTGPIPMALAPAGFRFDIPLNGTVSSNASLARPTTRTDIHGTWNMTVFPTNAIAGDKLDLQVS